MKTKYNIKDFSPHLFWDVDRNELDLETDARYIIGRVLEYGLYSDWQLIKNYYSSEIIKENALQLRSLEPTAMSFLCVVYNMKPEDFRCYSQNQSTQSFWNS